MIPANRQMIPHPAQIVSGLPMPQDISNQIIQEVTSPINMVLKIPTPAEALQQIPSPKKVLYTVPTPLEVFTSPPSIKELIGKQPTIEEMKFPKPPTLFEVLPTPAGWVERAGHQAKKSPFGFVDIVVDIVDTFLPG